MLSKSAQSKMDLVLEAAMQSIPYVGSPLATIYFGNKQEKRFQRIESFYEELKNDIHDLRIQIPSISMHDSDSLASIIEKINDRIESEHLEEKRRLYKNYFLKTLIDPVRTDNYDLRVLFLSILEKLTPTQIDILAFLRNRTGPVIDKSIHSPGVSDSLIQGEIAQLKILGLLNAHLHQIIFSSSGSMEESIQISQLGLEFHDFCMQ